MRLLYFDDDVERLCVSIRPRNVENVESVYRLSPVSQHSHKMVEIAGWVGLCVPQCQIFSHSSQKIRNRPIHSNSIHFIQFYSIHFIHFIQINSFYSILFILFNSIHFIQFYSIQFNSFQFSFRSNAKIQMALKRKEKRTRVHRLSN